MNALDVASAVVCFAAVVITIATALLAAFRSRHARALAPICRALGFGVVAVFALTLCFGAVRFARVSSSVPPPSQADRQRMLSNAIAELMYDALFTAILAAPAFVVSRYARRRSSPSSPPA